MPDPVEQIRHHIPRLSADGPPLRLADIAPRLGVTYDTLLRSWRDKIAAGELPPPTWPGPRPRWARALWLRFERGDWRPPAPRVVHEGPAAPGDDPEAAALDARLDALANQPEEE